MHKNDDLISRQAVLKLLSTMPPEEAMTKALLIQGVKQMDAAQPEWKRGKWIIHETETDRYDDMKCPFCKKSYTVDAYRIDDIGFTAADFNFCPNCGADMRGEQDE